MALFATPDFGAGATFCAVLGLIWLAVIAFALGCLVAGGWLLRVRTPARTAYGSLLILVSALLPLSCCMGPSILLKLSEGNGPVAGRPLDKIQRGMAREEVVELIGTPHNRYPDDDGEDWYYYVDSFGISWFKVKLGRDGRVKWTWSN